MWCCSKSAVPVRPTLRRRPTLTASTMHVLTLAHRRWTEVKGRTVRVWRGATLPSRIGGNQLEAVMRLEMWVTGIARKEVLQGIHTVRKRQLALRKIIQISEDLRQIETISQWKRANRYSKRKHALWKSAFALISKLTRRLHKSAVRFKLTHWKEVVFLQKTAYEDQVIEGGMRLAVVISLQGKAIAMQGFKAAQGKDIGAKRVFRIRKEREKAEIRGKVREWRGKTIAKAGFTQRKTAVQILKLIISLSVAQKSVKYTIFRKWANLPFSTHKISLRFYPKSTKKANLSSISRFQRLLKAPISPYILLESQNNQPAKSTERLKSVLALASHAKIKPAEMFQKWKFVVKTDAQELNIQYRLFARMGKIAQKRDLGRYFAAWKKGNLGDFVKICLRRLISYHNFTLFRSFSKWRNINISESSKVINIGKSFQIKLLSVLSQRLSLYVPRVNSAVSLQFLSLLLRKRLAGGFFIWKRETCRRDLEAIRAVSRIQGIKAFIETIQGRDLAVSFAKYRRNTLIKSTIRRFLIIFIRKIDIFRKIRAIFIWRSVLSAKNVPFQALQHFHSLQVKRLAGVFPFLTHYHSAPNKAFKRKSWASDSDDGEVEQFSQ